MRPRNTDRGKQIENETLKSKYSDNKEAKCSHLNMTHDDNSVISVF